MKKRRLKIIPLVIVILFIVGSIIGISSIIKEINYRKTYTYKLLQVGYTKEEISNIEKLTDESKDYLLEIEYDENVSKVVSEKYFLEKNLKLYLDYLKFNEVSLTDTIAIINVGSNNEWYTHTKKTDLSKGNLILTNKFYSLEPSYNSDSMVSISKTYCYGSNQMLTKDTFDAFLKMWKDAKEENLTLIINSSYRSYEEQDEVYDYYVKALGQEQADLRAARPGFSEHQTGMSIDIQTYGSRASTFEDFDEFKWLKDNAHKYGFILRYPKDKEYLTGYSYESWHFRYVGIEAATYIYENDITFDEYYAYFIEGNN